MHYTMLLRSKLGLNCGSVITCDDFLFISDLVRHCNFLIKKFLEICADIGVPVAPEKTEWSTPQMTFLGILLDGKTHCLCVPEEKRIRAINTLLQFIDRKKAQVRELQQLVGLLNFINKAVVPGRAFTRRMYSKFSGWDAKDAELKQFHHVRLDQEIQGRLCNLALFLAAFCSSWHCKTFS